MKLHLTKNEIIAVSVALQFSIDNGLADDYYDTETLYSVNENFKLAAIAEEAEETEV